MVYGEKLNLIFEKNYHINMNKEIEQHDKRRTRNRSADLDRW